MISAGLQSYGFVAWMLQSARVLAQLGKEYPKARRSPPTISDRSASAVASDTQAERCVIRRPLRCPEQLRW